MEKQIQEVLEQLQKALLESFEAAKAEEQAKLRKIKAHNELLLAKQELTELANQFN